MEVHAPKSLCSKQEKPLQWEACAPQSEQALLTATTESLHLNENPAQPENKNLIIKYVI